MSINSPCKKSCVLEAGVCQTCKRTIDEISRWPALSDKEKQVIVERISNNEISHT